MVVVVVVVFVAAVALENRRLPGGEDEEAVTAATVVALLEAPRCTTTAPARETVRDRPWVNMAQQLAPATCWVGRNGSQGRNLSSLLPVTAINNLPAGSVAFPPSILFIVLASERETVSSFSFLAPPPPPRSKGDVFVT